MFSEQELDVYQWPKVEDPLCIPRDLSGVYAVFGETEILYIGQSKDVRCRLTQHTRKKIFDKYVFSYAYKALEHKELLEEALIHRYKPVLERSPNTSPSEAKTHKEKVKAWNIALSTLQIYAESLPYVWSNPNYPPERIISYYKKLIMLELQLPFKDDIESPAQIWAEAQWMDYFKRRETFILSQIDKTLGKGGTKA